MENSKKIKYPKNNNITYNIKKQHKKRNYNEMIKQNTSLISEHKENSSAIKKKQKIQNSKQDNLILIKENLQTANRNNYSFDNEIFKNNIRLKEFNLNYNILLSEIIKSHSMRILNNNLYDKVINHLNLNSNEIRLIDVNKDGNCFYRVISYFLFSNEKYYNLIRLTLYDFIMNNSNSIINHNPYIDYFGKIYHFNDYVQFIKEDSFYAGDLEIAQANKCFKINISCYKYIQRENIYKKILAYYNNDVDIKINPLCILLYDDNIHHYKLILYNNSITVNRPKNFILNNNNENININKTIFIKGNNKNIDINKYSEYYKDEISHK